MELDFKELNVLVGFEVHQQLSTSSKLFCNCKCIDAMSYDFSFIRRLKPTQSELGIYDTAALFEFKKRKEIKYNLDSSSCCLVEADEEPPHNVNFDALNTALIIAMALKSNIVDEIHVMRKIVIDGSNTSGFQRTMLISTGGYIEANGRQVKVQSISLEEDAAKLISDNDKIREYGLDRLGIPLLEIALEPISGQPEEIANVALTLGRLLRTSKRVARGIGSIRQDVNISVAGGNIVEVKGVQQIDQLSKVIRYESLRQQGMRIIADKLVKSEEKKILEQRNITDLLITSESKIIKNILEKNGILYAIPLMGFSGIFSYEPYSDIRLGKELGELVRFYGLGGIFHSDELPNYGIDTSVLKKIKEYLNLTNNDAFIIIGGPREKIDVVIDAIMQRLENAKYGTPPETRTASPIGKTVFARPKPGSARLYPETDILPIRISKELLDSLKKDVPITWDQTINHIKTVYNINKQVAEQIFDSEYFDTFEFLTQNLTISPTFIASKLTEDIVNLQRQGYDASKINRDLIVELFTRLHEGSITKESISLILEYIMSKQANSIDDAISKIGLSVITEEEVNRIIDKIISDNHQIILEKRQASIGFLMGRSMAVLRGKYDGQKINAILKSKIEDMLTKYDKS